MAQRLPWTVLPFCNWSAVDSEAWSVAITPASIFDARRSLHDRSGNQCRVLCTAWGRWLGYLSQIEADIGAGGTGHLKRDIIKIYTESLFEHFSPVTVRSYMTSFLIVAEHMFPAEPLSDLRSVTRSIQKRISPVGKYMPELVDTVTLDHAATQMLHDAERVKNRYRAAGLYRDALASKMLVYAPLRIGNMGALRLGKEISKVGPQYRITVAGEHAKAKKPLTYPLPTSITPFIERYLEHYRPLLLECRGRHWQAGKKDAFWISRDGSEQRPRTLGRHIGDLTEQYLGTRVSPHRFRRIAATSIAVMAPDKINLIKGLLGHSTLSMSERHYNRAGTIQAGMKFQAIFNS